MNAAVDPTPTTDQQITLPIFSALTHTIKGRITEALGSNAGVRSSAVFDRTFVVLAFSMYAIGLIMVASSSMPVAERFPGRP